MSDLKLIPLFHAVAPPWPVSITFTKSNRVVSLRFLRGRDGVVYRFHVALTILVFGRQYETYFVEKFEKRDGWFDVSCMYTWLGSKYSEADYKMRACLVTVIYRYIQMIFPMIIAFCYHLASRYFHSFVLSYPLSYK